MTNVEQQQDFNAAVATVLDEFKGKFSLKIEQRAAREAFVAGKDVFAMLPTGFGKSLI